MPVIPRCEETRQFRGGCETSKSVEFRSIGHVHSEIWTESYLRFFFSPQGIGDFGLVRCLSWVINIKEKSYLHQKYIYKNSEMCSEKRRQRYVICRGVLCLGMAQTCFPTSFIKTIFSDFDHFNLKKNKMMPFIPRCKETRQFRGGCETSKSVEFRSIGHVHSEIWTESYL